jgi:hypothetical protein
MNRLATLLFIFLLGLSGYAQTDRERAKWVDDLIDESKLSTGAERARILKFDFAPMWVQRDDNGSVLGYIGANYQRLRLAIVTAVKDPNHPDLYNVTGKSMVKNVIRPFTGTMKITKVASAKEADMSEDHRAEGIKEAGFVFGEYHFAEDAKQTNTGKFDGVFMTEWVVDKDGRLLYDEVMMGADGYYNNQFLGKWTSYRTKVSKPASWGDSRIPLSGDLDMGAGEFAPDQKYVRNGWQGYVDAYGPKQDARALAEERRHWWK